MVTARAWRERDMGRHCFTAMEFQLSKMKGVLNMDGERYFISLDSTLTSG